MTVLFVRTSLLVAVFLVGHFMFVSSAVKIDVTTQYHDRAIPNAFNIRCTPNPQGNCAMTIISIQVDKDNSKNIANLRGQDSITYNPILKSSVSAEGHISTDLSETFLSVTVNEAVREDSGLYTCKILYIDESLQFKFVTASENVTVTEQDTQDIIKHLMSKISFLENLVQYELSTVKTTIVDQGAQLQTQALRINQTNSKILDKSSHLQDMLLNQSQRIDDMIAREELVVNFMAVYGGGGVFQAGRDLVFSDVITNEGGGYDGDTGTFRAPVAGHYLLHVSVFSTASRQFMYLRMETSQHDVLTKLFIGDNDGWNDYSDGSCIAKLEAGVKVKLVVELASAGFALQTFENGKERHSKVYGYLIKPL